MRCRSRSSSVRRALAAAAALLAQGCAGRGGECTPSRIAVLAAMPAELAPLVARARLDRIEAVGEHRYRIGEIQGVPVVLAMTGIGMQNAASVARELLDHFEVSGVVVSGVAGSALRIGDVAVPEQWQDAAGATSAADPAWLAAARALAARGTLDFERCTRIPDAPERAPICLSHLPELVVRGVGSSSDPFGGARMPCRVDGGDVFGCDVSAAGAPSRPPDGIASSASQGAESPGEGTAFVKDMETAAIGAEAAARGLRFIAFRAVSDGEGDPLGLPRFPAQFFVYYRLASGNAALAVEGFLAQLAAAQAASACGR